MPLNSELEGGVVLRNDATRGISYRFICNRGFVINGSSHVSCEDGVYNGSSPNCLPKGTFEFFLFSSFKFFLDTIIIVKIYEEGFVGLGIACWDREVGHPE